MRIGVWEQFYGVPVDPEIRAAVRLAAALAGDLGFAVDGFEPRGLERAPNLWSFFFNQWLDKGKELTAEAALLNLAARDAMRASLLRQMEDVPAILMPVFGIAAFRHGESRWQVEGKEIGLFQAAHAGGGRQRTRAAGGDHSDGGFQRGSAHRRAIDGAAL